MRYRITHRTEYGYSEAVPICHNALRLTPRDLPNQHRESFVFKINPEPSILSSRIDTFGNEVTYFSIEYGYTKMRIETVSVMDRRPSPKIDADTSAPWESVVAKIREGELKRKLEVVQFRYDSPLVTTFDEMREYALVSFTPGRPIVAAAKDLMSRIYTDFKYDTQATTVETSVQEAFALKKGVCQDLAHIMIGCFRSLGLASRYVSGYLRTIPAEGKDRLIGADASHAWASLYCDNLGWFDLDPTNDVVPSEDHITLIWGRDYQDVTPVRGLYVGGGQHTMGVSVDVAPLDELPALKPSVA
ncbi:transglutaminase family protein [Calycomorphotria hydatis]|uniref:Transglutaminase-like domain-containing protein n=1 Tax=Calycomorphotria hydatis TaxID=2528027 RepID=A0A517T9R9_9PLAN|nr:transglutaminase family protein [Calycomorphotria hydatis]QDT65099.1 hypothetical protein V22_23450 [Calycomorphotria hydatis]